MDAHQLKSALLLPPVIIGLYWIHTAWSRALAGVIAVVVGTLVACDYRGIAARIPSAVSRSWVSQNRSVGAKRRAFAGVAAWGVLMILLAFR